MHDIVIELSSSLPKDVVESIIKQYVEERTGKSVSKIEAKVKDNSFVGFSIKYNSEVPEQSLINTDGKHKKPVVIDKTFREMVFD